MPFKNLGAGVSPQTEGRACNHGGDLLQLVVNNHTSMNPVGVGDWCTSGGRLVLVQPLECSLCEPLHILYKSLQPSDVPELGILLKTDATIALGGFKMTAKIVGSESEVEGFAFRLLKRSVSRIQDDPAQLYILQPELFRFLLLRYFVDLDGMRDIFAKVSVQCQGTFLYLREGDWPSRNGGKSSICSRHIPSAQVGTHSS